MLASAVTGFAAGAVPGNGVGPDGVPVLTNFPQVLLLGTNASVSNRYNARVRGVIIYVSPPTRRLYVQDGEVGLQANMVASVASFRPGQLIEVEGEVGDELPHPRILKGRAKVLGEAPLPEPKRTSAEFLAAGKDAFRFVTVRGVVRDMTSDRSGLILLLAEENRLFELAIPVADFPLPRAWLDAEIEVTGIAYPFYNARRQPVTFRFHSPSLEFVHATKPGSGTLFDRPTLTIAEAVRQPWEWQPRLKIAGTVTAHQPADVLFVDDGTGQMQVNLLSLLYKPEIGQSLRHEAPAWFQPGDRVEVIGVRHTWSSLTPTLIQAEVRHIGKVSPVQPRPVSIDDLQAGHLAGSLISVEARLLDQRLWTAGGLVHQLLVLQANDQVFKATWESDLAADWNLTPGSYVRVTGVNDAMQGQFKGARIFNLLLRSPSDVVRLPDPPFWSRREFRRIALAATGATLLALAWMFFQRAHLRRLEHRVAERTADLSHANERLQEEVAARQRAEVEVQRALAQERELHELKSRFVSMVSHEFRTPLGIIMSSAEILDAYLDRLPPDERAANLKDITDATRHMGAMMEEVLLLSRVEAGKMTFRPADLNLALLCERLVDEAKSATGERCPIQLQLPDDLPAGTGDEALLRHIFSNLLSNAVKYSAPGMPVALGVSVQGDLAVFRVEDHGIGIPEADQRQIFQPFHRGQNVENVSGTGLGMTIVKRCVELHGGKITFESRVGEGTRFFVTLPLFGSPVGRSDGRTPHALSAAGGGESIITS